MSHVYIEVNNNLLYNVPDIKRRIDALTQENNQYSSLWTKRIIDLWSPNYKELKEWKSAVLIPLVLTSTGEWAVIMTVRSSKISLHDNEVSLPGGKWDRTDESIVDTALRESYEEIGLTSDNVNIVSEISKFPTYRRKKRYAIYPVVGIVKKTFYAKLNKREVKDVFLLPLRDFLFETSSLYPRYDGVTVNGTGIVYRQPYFVYGVTYNILAVLAAVMFPPEDVACFMEQLNSYVEQGSNYSSVLRACIEPYIIKRPVSKL